MYLEKLLGSLDDLLLDGVFFDIAVFRHHDKMLVCFLQKKSFFDVLANTVEKFYPLPLPVITAVLNAAAAAQQKAAQSFAGV
jgi:hypothetical protein